MFFIAFLVSWMSWPASAETDTGDWTKDADGTQFPAEYKGDIFAAFHSSWNRERRTGYKIVRVPFDKSTGKRVGITKIS